MTACNHEKLVQWLKPRDKIIVEHWLNGMTIKSISTLIRLNRGTVRETISTYCDRELVHTPGNPVYFFRLAREIHPDAPLLPQDIARLFPAADPTDSSDGSDLDPVLIQVANACDQLNAVLDHAYGRGHRNHIHLQLRNGRLHCIVRADL